MSELKVHRFITTDELFPEANAGVLYYEKPEADNVIAELEEKLDGMKLSRDEWARAANDKDKQIAELKDENRKLKRALWMARTEMAKTSAWVFWNRKDDYNYNKWKKVERKCRDKAKEYK